MQPTTTLTSKNQMTLPKSVREDLNLKPGDKVAFKKEGENYVLVPKTRSALDLAGILYDPDRPTLSMEDMDEAIGEAVSERYERSLERR